MTQLYKNVNNKKLNKPGQFLTQCSFCVLVPLVYHHLIQCSTYAQFYPEIQKLINNNYFEFHSQQQFFHANLKSFRGCYFNLVRSTTGS